ncbi:MAG: PAS domain S-box protein [Candidatus Marinimicrobia bacterium]|jgi:PAS domain S-box-containing protein|nr:PAS domain S-box protein [Candidatus Neomarinimicrobiota bacterium]MBT3680977.1 PAS domain S-box protein [Candidatus Neomarinimicrobiota bacterium]MBT3952110.1 PAS domain S-box protein [Candidatus Neomarinimicrobiota bacterium]MBT4254308.1 PAS domain S-box protein [Candidatus Neomarinimicrobiota bacterium]MBT4479489.1 PAS domain S-box protein [Candidatus Neomarinimicrobiota bacterium]
MPDNQRSIRLLLDFDQAISWPETKRVTKKALSFFDTHLQLERVSITFNDIQNQSLEVFTKDTSIPHLASGDKHPISSSPTQKTGTLIEPKYISDITTISNPSSVVQALSSAGVRSYFDVPLVIGDDVVGSLNIGSRQKDGVSQETQEIVILLSARLSLALYHARLHDDLKQKEAALEASEKSYRELIDQAADVILKGDFQGNIIQANIAASRLLGYSNEELLQMNLSQLFEPDVLIRKPLRYDLLEEGLTVLSERVFRAKNDNHVPVEMNSKKLSDGTLVTIVRDLSERNKTKERLIDQKNQITALFDATPTLMYAKDPDGRYTMLNDAYLNFFGKKREDMLGKKVTEIWKTPSAKRVEKEDLKLLQDNELQSHATEFKNASGALRQMLARKAVYLDAQGEPAGFVGTLMDYTDLKAAEDRYKALFANSPDPVVVHDGAVLLAANQAAISFFKAGDNDKYLKTPVSNFIHPDSIAAAKNRIEDLLSSKSPNKIMRQKFVVSTGEVRDVDAMSVSLMDGGRPIIMTSFRDVTDAHATRQALLNSEERYRLAFKYSPTAMVVHDRGVLLDANQAALSFVGANSLEEVRGIDLFSLVHPDFREVSHESVELLLETGTPSEGVREHKYLTLAGEERWVEISGVVVKHTDKPVILLSFNDIHDRVTAREQLEKSRQQLEVITSHLTSYIFLVDLNLSLLYVNNATAELLNINSDALFGTPLKNIITKAEMGIALKYLPRLLKGEACSFPHHYISQGQGEFEFILTLIPISSEDGKVKSILVQMDDVTAIESAQKEIAENKELLELIVDTIPGLFSYSDMNEKYLYVNEAYASWYGYDKADVIGKSFSQIIPEDTYLEIQPYLSRISTGEPLSYSRTTTGPDGRAHDLDIRYIPHFDLDNKPKAFLTSLHDVTKRNEYELFRDSLRRLARQLTVSLDPREVCVIAATLLHDLFGYDAFALYQINHEENTAVGLFAQDTFTGDDRLVEVETEVNPLDLDNSVATFILPSPKLLNRKEDDGQPIAAPFGDSTRRSMSLVFVPIFWEGIQIGAFSLQSYTVEHFKDDDLQKLKVFANQIGGALVRARADELILEQTNALKDRELQLQSTIKEKEVLLKEVYHRTKNNMQVIVGLLEMQGMKTSSAEAKAVVDEMTNRIYSMSMVHDLLYRSRNLAEIMLDTYLQNLVNRLILAYKTTLGDITLECQSEPIPINIQTAIPLGLVINEIVSNALKYGFPDHRDGKIIVRTESFGKDGLDIEIGDDGVGVASGDELSGDETLGLQIIRDIIDLQLFGTLKASSKDGVKYLITIPSLKLD